jgi:Uma2 family endonuclease
MDTQVLDKPIIKSKPEVFYPTEERKKMGETDFHYQQIKLLFDMLQIFFESRQDVYFASDIMFYYEEGNANKRFAPDLMICFGVKNEKRRSYKLWEEKVVPSVVIEVASNATWEKDVTTKRRLYEKLGVQEYYVLDPEYKYLPQPMIAYRLEFGELVRLSIQNDRIFSEALKLDLVNTGEDFRLFDLVKDAFILTVNDISALQNEIERLKKLLNQ